MSKCCPDNERAKRSYSLYLEAANGKQTATVDGALRAIERFEKSTGRKSFRKFHIEQARSFRLRFLDETGPTGKPLSAATIAATLKHLRNFFLWLSREPGYRRAVNANDAAYFTPSDQDRRIASARRELPVPTLEDFERVLSHMPAKNPIEARNRAAVAFALLSGARDGAMASFRLRHVDIDRRTVFHDARVVRTKGRKTFTSHFFPVGSQPLAIVSSYLALLADLGFGPDDPLFPATRVGLSADRAFEPQGLSRSMWTTGAPIRQIFRAAFHAAGLPYANPHSVRKTLARLGERICRTPEEWKAWSQNFGHESEMTTFVGYGEMPVYRRAEILRHLADPPKSGAASTVEIAALESLVESMKAAASRPA